MSRISFRMSNSNHFTFFSTLLFVIRPSANKHWQIWCLYLKHLLTSCLCFFYWVFSFSSLGVKDSIAASVVSFYCQYFPVFLLAVSSPSSLHYSFLSSVLPSVLGFMRAALQEILTVFRCKCWGKWEGKTGQLLRQFLLPYLLPSLASSEMCRALMPKTRFLIRFKQQPDRKWKTLKMIFKRDVEIMCGGWKNIFMLLGWRPFLKV